MRKVSNNILSRVYVLFGLFLLFGLAVVLRVLSLQVDYDVWAQREAEEQIFFKKIVADRGSILAEDGTLMATSIPFYKMVLDPTMIDTTQWDNFEDSLMSLATLMADYFGGEEKDTLAYYRRVRKAMAEQDRHIYLSRKKINFQELEMVKQWPILRRGRWKAGFTTEKFENERHYPFGQLARITLGRLVNDTVGIRGIEASFNRELRGEDGYVLAQKLPGEAYVPLDQFGEAVADDGLDVRTTLDVDLQDIVESALKQGVERHFAKYGVAILMEVETGEIKALANYPETYNNAVATQIEPGSTFKIASAAALIEDGLVDLCDTIDTGDGTMMYDDKEITDNGHAYGLIEFEPAIAHSSNVAISKLVSEEYGPYPDMYLDRLRSFGFYEPANNQLRGEPIPKIIEPGHPEWNIATLPSMSYGYSLLVTPIQMAAFYNGLANNGKLMRPYLVKEIRNNSRIIQTYAPEVVNPEMLSQRTVDLTKETMKAVVRYGTASRQFRNVPFQVAGKTGTARKTENGRYVKKYRASFGGFFPANHPRYTLYIMVDEPDAGVASGAKVAAPIFRRIAEEVHNMDTRVAEPPVMIAQKELPKRGTFYAKNAQLVYEELGMKVGELDEVPWMRLYTDSGQTFVEHVEVEEGIIPDVRGMSARDAMNLLEGLGVKVLIRGKGRVRRQTLQPGYRMGEDVAITLYLS